MRHKYSFGLLLEDYIGFNRVILLFQPQLVQAIKQVADVMLDQKAVIHSMEYLGHKPFSARMNKEGQAYLDGS